MQVDGIQPTARRARNPVDGKNEIISWESFEDWRKENGLQYNKRGILVAK
jgi:hypothetical protein